jgi:hypothetical protein
LLQEVSRSGFSGVSDDAYRQIIRRLAYYPEMTLRRAWELGQVWIQDVNAAEETKVYSRDGFAVNWEPSYLNDFAKAFGAAHWRNPEKFVSRLKADLEGIPSEAKVGRGDIVREAFNGAARFWSESQSAEALAEALKLPPSLRSVGIQQILSSMVERSPQVALRLARAIPAEHRLDLDEPMQLAAELGDLSGFQLLGDAEWMVSGPLPVSPKLESYVKASGRFVDVYARKIANTHPEGVPAALQWLGGLENVDPEMHLSAIKLLSAVWVIHDDKAAAAWVQAQADPEVFNAASGAITELLERTNPERTRDRGY